MLHRDSFSDSDSEAVSPQTNAEITENTRAFLKAMEEISMEEIVELVGAFEDGDDIKERSLIKKLLACFNFARISADSTCDILAARMSDDPSLLTHDIIAKIDILSTLSPNFTKDPIAYNIVNFGVAARTARNEKLFHGDKAAQEADEILFKEHGKKLEIEAIYSYEYKKFQKLIEHHKKESDKAMVPATASIHSRIYNTGCDLQSKLAHLKKSEPRSLPRQIHHLRALNAALTSPTNKNIHALRACARQAQGHESVVWKACGIAMMALGVAIGLLGAAVCVASATTGVLGIAGIPIGGLMVGGGLLLFAKGLMYHKRGNVHGISKDMHIITNQYVQQQQFKKG